MDQDDLPTVDHARGLQPPDGQAVLPAGRAPMDAHTVVVMKCSPGRVARKRWTLRDGQPYCEEYGLGDRFGFSLGRAETVQDLYSITRAIEDQPDRFVIRSRPKEEAFLIRTRA